MKKIFSLLCTGVVILTAQAQSDSTFKFQYRQPYGLRQFNPLPQAGLQKREVHIPAQSKSGFVRSLPNPMVFAYNNGKGFDMYESKIDNMPILKPDAKTEKILGMKPSTKTGK